MLENLETLCLYGVNAMIQLTDILFTDKCLQNVHHLYLEDYDDVTMKIVYTLLSSSKNKISIFLHRRLLWARQGQNWYLHESS